MRTWLIVIGALVTFGILLDSIRRMRRAGRDSYTMDFQMQKGLATDDHLDYTSELPNGGARKVEGAEVSTPQPRHSAAFLAKEAAKARQANPGQSADQSPAREKVEPRFSAPPSFEDTSKIRRTPTLPSSSGVPATPSVPAPRLSADVDLDQSVPMLMDAHERSEATFTDDADLLADGAVLGRPRVVPRKPMSEPTPDEQQEVIVINVISRLPEGFVGSSLLESVLGCGMRFGSMNIFHHYAPVPDDDSTLFSMANIIKPGIFDLNNMQSFQTPGVSFFMILPLKGSANISIMDAFDKMLASAKYLAQQLNGELKDERRSVMTGQTIEHCRQRISEFSRKNLSRSGKFTADSLYRKSD